MRGNRQVMSFAFFSGCGMLEVGKNKDFEKSFAKGVVICKKVSLDIMEGYFPEGEKFIKLFKKPLFFTKKCPWLSEGIFSLFIQGG